MNESLRTLIFAGVAVVSVAVAWFVHASSQPEEAEVFAQVGTEFYPEFADPTKAGALEVIDSDPETTEIRRFNVEFNDGKWRIPSHHGYPADAEDRLEKAAASLIGITRESLAGRRANAHERYGVVDPLDEDTAKLDGRGQRIILKDKDDNVLADYVLGKQVAGQNNLYYVRIPGKDETYRATVDLDVSTKFADWVEKDLLKLDRNDLTRVEFKTAELADFVTPDGFRVQMPVKKTTVAVHRPDTGAGVKWQVDDLKAETEEINTTGVSAIQTALDGLELTGVRPKPQGLTPNLKVDIDRFPKGQNPNQYFNRTLIPELGFRGFTLTAPSEKEATDTFELYGDGGELVAQTDQGLVYHLHLGKVFSGNETEIEVGKTEVVEDPDAPANSETPPKTDDQDKEDDAEKSKTTLNRYLFIRVAFDPSLLGEAPEKPVEPEKPAGLKDDAETPKAGDEEAAANEKKPDDEQAKLKADYEQQKQVYEANLARYNEDKKDYDAQVKAAKDKEKELNDRFAEWYYVIAATSYEGLAFTRDEIVKKKEAQEAGDPHGTLPGVTPPAQSPPAQAEKPAREAAPVTPGTEVKEDPASAEKTPES